MMLENNIHWKNLSDTSIVREIGKSLRVTRLKKNLTQEQLAKTAGLDRTTVVQLEKGRSATILTLIQILRVLDKLEPLEGLQEETGVSPLQMVKQLERGRKRASAPAKPPGKKKFAW